MGHQLTGKMKYEDVSNNIVANYEFGNVRKKTQDFFTGQILKDDKVVSEIRGNYMGFIDFDGLRYWDIRERANIWFPVSPQGERSLPSDSTKRQDSIILASGDAQGA